MAWQDKMPGVLMLREKWSYIKSFCFFYKSVNRSKDNEVIFSTEILISKQKRSQAKWMIKNSEWNNSRLVLSPYAYIGIGTG